MENIDDDLEKEGIVIVRIDNDAEAKEYGIDHLPALIYFEDKLPAIYEGKFLQMKVTKICMKINHTVYKEEYVTNSLAMEPELSNMKAFQWTLS
jgi:hypothetical protein